MAFPILGNPKPAFFDSNGAPLVSGTITTLDPADDSVKASYPTADDANAGTNGTSGDITLDSRGEPTSTQYWGQDGEDYKVVIKDSSGSTIYTLDDIRMAGSVRRTLTTVGSSDATPSVAAGDSFRLNDTTITDFDDGEVGDTIYIYGPSSSYVLVTSNSNILLKNQLDHEMTTNDVLVLKMFEDQVWHEISRANNAGSAWWIDLTTTTTLTEGDNGRTLYLDSATGFATTLPAPARGLKFDFICATQPTTGAHTVVTTSSANIIYGSIFEADGTAAAASAEDTITFVSSTALPGDWVSVVSDGTNWYMKAFTSAGGGITASAT